MNPACSASLLMNDTDVRFRLLHTYILERVMLAAFSVEIDRYIGLPIFFTIYKHFTIIGYRFCKKIISVLIFFFIHT